VDLFLNRRFCSVTRARYTAFDSLVWGMAPAFQLRQQLLRLALRVGDDLDQGVVGRADAPLLRIPEPRMLSRVPVKRAPRRRSLGRGVAPPLGLAAPIG